MRILVTGHNGYIGAVTAPMLQAAGHEVVGLDCYLFGDDCTFGPRMPDPMALAKDVRDAQIKDLEGFDAIIHGRELRTAGTTAHVSSSRRRL